MPGSTSRASGTPFGSAGSASSFSTPIQSDWMSFTPRRFSSVPGGGVATRATSTGAAGRSRMRSRGSARSRSEIQCSAFSVSLAKRIFTGARDGSIRAFMKPPFRADHVGSLLRPPELLKDKCDRDIQDRAIRAVVKKQEAIGLEGITDGELRRAWWHLDFLSQLEGVTLRENPGPKFGGTEEQPAIPTVTGKLRYAKPIMVEDFSFLRENTGKTAKFTIPSPSMLHPRARRPPRGNGGDPAYLPRQLQERLGRRRRLRPGRRGDVLVPGRRLFHGVRLGARRRLRTAALRPQGKESGPWVGFKQDGFSRKDGTTETQDRRRLALRAARKPVPVAAMRLRQHASRQPAVAGRTVAQARARGRNRQGGLEMSTEKEILALEDRRCAAMAAGDLASLEKLLHDELLYTHSSGVMDTKASWLLSMKSGKTRYKSVKCSGQQVRIFGDVALVTGRGHIEAEINGQPRTLRLMFLDAWAKTPQGWKFVAWQSTPQPA